MDPFITLGTLFTFRMAISKVMISIYIKIVEKYSGATKLKGEQGDQNSKQRGLCNCCCCWLPAIVSGLLLTIVLPIGFVTDLFLWIFSCFDLKLSLTNLNLKMISIQLVNYLITYINIIDTTQSISQNPKQMCQPSCYSYQTRCFTFCHILFGIPLFLIFSIFNVLLIVTALADSFITIGSFAYYYMIVSENLLHFYKQCVSGYSQAIDINGSKGDCAAVHGVCTCFLCWAPVLTSILLSLTLIPIGLVADILLLLFSLFRFRLQVTKTNIFVMIVTCRVYQSLVQSQTSDKSVRTDIHSNIDSFQDIARHL